MFEDIPLIHMNVKILRFWSLIYNNNWRRYLCISLSTLLVLTQFNYMYCAKEGIVGIIRNSYVLVLWFNTILRAYMLLHNRNEYEQLINNLRRFYYDLEDLNDPFINNLLTDVNSIGRFMSRGNLVLGIITCIGFSCYPMFTVERVLPFGSVIPGIDEYSTPFYEILYAYHVIITPMGCCMYIPYTTLIVALVMFGIVMCKALQHRLHQLSKNTYSQKSVQRELIECIKYQNRIFNYISTVNKLITYIFLLEFLAFGALLCALLFLLIIVESSAQLTIVYAYITMILAQIFSLYWYANELREQSFGIATAAYETEWFTFSVPTQKIILLLILRAQKPSSIMVGNIRPMTLELFQALLNTSYSYFTLLKRFYG